MPFGDQRSSSCDRGGPPAWPGRSAGYGSQGEYARADEDSSADDAAADAAALSALPSAPSSALSSALSSTLSSAPSAPSMASVAAVSFFLAFLPFFFLRAASTSESCARRLARARALSYPSGGDRAAPALASASRSPPRAAWTTAAGRRDAARRSAHGATRARARRARGDRARLPLARRGAAGRDARAGRPRDDARGDHRDRTRPIARLPLVTRRASGCLRRCAPTPAPTPAQTPTSPTPMPSARPMPEMVRPRRAQSARARSPRRLSRSSRETRPPSVFARKIARRTIARRRPRKCARPRARPRRG